MSTKKNKIEIFETMPIPKAVAELAIPTILSQLVLVAYNLGDMLFIGRTGDPLKVAAVSLAYPAFMMLNAIGNLFGVGGGSLIARLLGAKRPEDAGRAASFSFYTSIALALVYSLAVYAFMDPVLRLMGASADTIGFGREYLLWTVVVGGVPSTLSLVCANLLRGEGRTGPAGVGVAAGGILNLVLDPIFIFPLGLGVAGAAIATMLSNVAVSLYFLILLLKKREGSVLSISPKDYTLRGDIVQPVLSVGFPAAIAMVLVCVSNAILTNLASGYGDTPVAAFGIVKKVDSVVMGVGLGLGQGILPLVGYNYSAGNHARMRGTTRFAFFAGMAFAAVCIALFEWQADGIVSIFIPDPETVALGGRFLRVASLAMPFIVANYLLNTTFQAMGKGRASLVFSVCRQGVITIPLLFFMHSIMGLMGLIWNKLIADSITLVLGFLLYAAILKKNAPGEEQPA